MFQKQIWSQNEKISNKSVVGSIKDRIQNAIKKSQNNRYNRDAVDQFGDMDFQIPESNVQELDIEKPQFEETQKDLNRNDPILQINPKPYLRPIQGDYKVKFGDYRFDG